MVAIWRQRSNDGFERNGDISPSTNLVAGENRFYGLTQKPFSHTRRVPHPTSSVQVRGHWPTESTGADVNSVANPPRRKYRRVDHHNRSGHRDRCTKRRRLGRHICLYLHSRMKSRSADRKGTASLSCSPRPCGTIGHQNRQSLSFALCYCSRPHRAIEPTPRHMPILSTTSP